MRNTICVIAVMLGMFFAFSAVDGKYVQKSVVVNVDNDVVTIQTENGNYFEFFGDGFVVGDVVNVTFHDNETVGITDDFIIDCEICTNQI